MYAIATIPEAEVEFHVDTADFEPGSPYVDQDVTSQTVVQDNTPELKQAFDVYFHKKNRVLRKS
jgi:hypothetical protein